MNSHVNSHPSRRVGEIFLNRARCARCIIAAPTAAWQPKKSRNVSSLGMSLSDSQSGEEHLSAGCRYLVLRGIHQESKLQPNGWQGLVGPTVGNYERKTPAPWSLPPCFSRFPRLRNVLACLLERFIAWLNPAPSRPFRFAGAAAFGAPHLNATSINYSKYNAARASVCHD